MEYFINENYGTAITQEDLVFCCIFATVIGIVFRKQLHLTATILIVP